MLISRKKLSLLLLPFVIAGLAFIHQNNQASEVYAVNPLTVTYDGDSTPDPMFKVFNMLPGDEVIKDFNVESSSPSSVNVEMFASLTDVEKDFDEILTIEITEIGPSTLIFSGVLEDFLGHTPFSLGNFSPNADKTYRVKVKFPSSAGNEYQEAKVVFDIIWQTKLHSVIELPPECSHLEGKIDHTIRGNERNNHLVGTHGNDFIIGFGGNDHIDGKGGDDCIVGRDGNDKLEGGSGDDIILGGNGNDKLDGESGKDKLYGEAGNDNMFGGSNNDFLDGGPNHDFLKGESGTDTCVNGEAVHSSCEL